MLVKSYVTHLRKLLLNIVIFTHPHFETLWKFCLRGYTECHLAHRTWTDCLDVVHDVTNKILLEILLAGWQVHQHVCVVLWEKDKMRKLSILKFHVFPCKLKKVLIVWVFPSVSIWKLSHRVLVSIYPAFMVGCWGWGTGLGNKG